MQFEFTSERQIDKKVVLTHKGESIEFPTKAWKQIDRQSLVFREINEYWATLPMSTQDAIWEIYKELYVAFDEIKHFERLHTYVRKKVGELFTQMPYEQLLYFVQTRSKVKYPLDLRDDYGEGAPKGELTYLRREYVELVALLLQLRAMIPIWGGYINNTRDDLGTEHKDYQAGLLLKQSEVVNSAPWLRLSRYIEAYLGETDLSLALNLSGITRANFPNWLMNVTIVKKLVIQELVNSGSVEEATNIMSKVYNYIRPISDDPQRFFKGRLEDKTERSSGDNGDDDNTSRIESVKVHETVSEGDRVHLEYYLEQSVKLAQQIDCTIPVELVHQCCNFILSDRDFQPQDYKFWLTQWTICGNRVMRTPQGWVRSAVCSPKALLSLRYESQISAFATTQALLWHWGFHDLASIITSRGVPLSTNIMLGSSVYKLEKETINLLTELYPMATVTRARKSERVAPWPNGNPEALQKQAVQNCVALKEIDIFIKTIMKIAWRKDGPRDLIAMCEYQDRGEYLLASPKIKQQLADMVIASKMIPGTQLGESFWSEAVRQ